MKLIFFLCLIALGYNSIGQPLPLEYMMNSRVEILSKDGTPKARGTVKQVIGSGRYKVQPDGCFDAKSEIVGIAQLRPAAIIEKTDSSLLSTTGNWEVFAYEYPKDYKYKGATSVPLEIKSDGTYVWYDAYNNPPIINVWLPYAKLDGAKKDSDLFNSIILMDRYEMYWKAYVDKENRLVVKRLCSETVKRGDRIQ